MLLVDSSVWIDYFNGHATPQTEYLDQALSQELILVGDLVLAEVLQGFRSDADFEAARQALLQFELVSMVSPALAMQSVLNYRRLRKLGLTVRKIMDCLIATFCIENGHTLLHSDADFDAFERRLGLQVVVFNKL